MISINYYNITDTVQQLHSVYTVDCQQTYSLVQPDSVNSTSY